MKKTILLLILFQIHTIVAQEVLYVSAKNGLIVRSGPDKSYKKIGKLDYSEKIDTFQSVNRFDEITDNNTVIKGEWYLISTKNIEQGYVFSGFLTSEEPKKNMIIKFKNLTVEFEHIPLWNSEITLAEIQKDTVKLSLDLTGSPENKKIKIKSTGFKTIELYQRFQNSITIMNEGPHCDLTEWNHYDSNWEKIPFNKERKEFLTLKYSEEDNNQFIPLNIEELQNAVKDYCGEYWSKLIANIKNPTEYPSGVSTSVIYIKIVTTDENNNISEKILEFIIPMEC